MHGSVTGSGGETIGDATVRAIHVPTGTVFEVNTRPNGQYNIRGMRVGGPYTVQVSAVGYQTTTQRDIYLSLRQDHEANYDLPISEGEIVLLDEFQVVASEVDFTFDASKMGTSTNIGSEDIDSMPTVSRSLTDFVRLDPRVSVFDRENGSISAGGQNNRYNSLMIDGVPADDSFGLEENGLPAKTQPYSLESIAEITVETSPYTVLQAGFTGAAVNAITKSGTNKFKGSLYYYFRNESMTGDRLEFEDKTDGLDGTYQSLEEFTEDTFGFTLGGPILKDKLFFFVNFERFKITTLPPFREFDPTGPALQRIRDAAESVGLEIGDFEIPNNIVSTDDKFLLKLDWNINPKHRMSFRYTSSLGEDPQFPSYGGGTISFSSHWFKQIRDNKNFLVEIFSRWTDNITTETKVSFNRYDRFRENNSDAPQVEISSVTGTDGNSGTVRFGRQSSGHANELRVDTTIVQFHADIFKGNHTFTVGTNIEHVNNHNLFISDSRGRWRYDNITSFEISTTSPGAAANYDVSFPVGGSDGAADWTLTTYSFFGEDNWDILPRLKLTAGVRVDIPTVDDKIPENPDFEEVFGLSQTNTIDGNLVIQPRFGFNWALDDDRKTQFRGGFGLFYGRAPHVWMSNPFINNGVTILSARPNFANTPQFSPDGDNPPIPDNVQPVVAIDLLDEDFKMPSLWKGNIAVDRKLPWWDLRLSMEANWSITKQDVHYMHLNLDRAESNITGETLYLPDGRNLYQRDSAGRRGFENEGFDNVFLLTNTDKGHSANYTVKLERPRKNGIYFSLGYTYGSAQSVNDSRSASASGNWGDIRAANPNDDILATSIFETRHRIVGTISYDLKLFKRAPTNISVVYDGHTGRPYSYTYRSDVNNDSNFDNDLVYIPASRDDILVINRFFPRELDEFDEFINERPGLYNFRGSILPRNTGRAPWNHQIDLKVTQQFKVWKDHRVEFSVAIQNLGNLIDEEFGLERRATGDEIDIVQGSPFFVSLPGAENGLYEYRFNSGSFENINATLPSTQLSSRWSILLGVKYSF